LFSRHRQGCRAGHVPRLDNGPATILSPHHAFDLPMPMRGAGASPPAPMVSLDINLVKTEKAPQETAAGRMRFPPYRCRMPGRVGRHGRTEARDRAITERAMRGELDFEGRLIQRVGMLKGLKLDALECTYARVRLNPGAKSLLATMRATAHTMLVSGVRLFTQRVAQPRAFSERGNTLLDDGTALTGEVAAPILGR